MSNAMPKCPGCGRDMLPNHRAEPGDRPWECTTCYVQFECQCGWQAPERWGNTFQDAFVKALDAATKRR